MNVRLYVWQRATAGLLAIMIVVHLAVIFYATGHALTAAEILARTRGNAAWAAFYGTFVVAAAIHASIGVRTVLREWAPMHETVAASLSWMFGLALLGLGLRAVVAVTVP